MPMQSAKEIQEAAVKSTKARFAEVEEEAKKKGFKFGHIYDPNKVVEVAVEAEKPKAKKPEAKKPEAVKSDKK